MDFKRNNISHYLMNAFSGSAKKEHEHAVSQMVEAIKRQRTLYTKEIRDWKRAQAAALDPTLPRRNLLIDIYEDVLGDAFIFGRSETRKLRISNKPVVIQNEKGDVDEKATKLLDKLWFINFKKYVHESIYFGYSLIYPKDLDENGHIKKLSYVHREHIVPEHTEILKNTYDQSGVNFLEGNLKRWTLWVDHEHSIGLLNKAVPLWIFKKHSWQNWDEFEEMFGIPMRTAKVASSDPRVKREVDKWLKDLGSAGWARFPEGVEVDIKESQSRDSFNVFNEKRKACNEELATLFDGHFETAKDTGSRSKAEEIIKATQGLITLDDEAFVLSVINDQLLPWLIELGYPLKDTHVAVWNDNEQMTPKDRLDIFKGVKELGYKIKKEQIESELDVEIVGEIQQGFPFQPQNPQNHVNFNLPHGRCDHGANRVEFPTNEIELSPEEEAFLKLLYESPESINWSYKEFVASHEPLLDAMKRNFGKFNFDFDSTDHRRMRAWMDNIHRFGVDKTQAEIYELNEILKNAENFQDFRNKAKAIFPKYKEYYLQTEWDHATAISDMAARQQEMMDDIGVSPYWKFDAILDERTTDNCSHLHGKVFDKRDKNSWKFLPPLHWKCRSDAQDVLDNYDGEITSFEKAVGLDPGGWDRMQKQGFDVNWGDSDEVFTKAQSYLKRLPTDHKAINVDQLGIVDYDLPTWADVKKHDAPSTGLSFNKMIDRTGMIRLATKDHLPLWLDKKDLKRLDLKRIKETIEMPDEVFWSDASGKNVYTYFRYYKDGAFKVTSESVKITNYELLNDHVDEIRKGLLIFTPKAFIDYSRKLYRSFDKTWKRDFFNDKNGGYLVTSKGRIEQSKKSKREGVKFKKEWEMSKNYANAGYRIEIIDEDSRLGGVDVLFNGIHSELKSVSSHNNIIKEAKDAVVKKKALIVLFEFTNDTPKIREKIAELKRKGYRTYYYFSDKPKEVIKNF